MPISSVSQPNLQSYPVASSPAKPAGADASAAASPPAATPSAAPGSDAKTAAPDTDAPSAAKSESKQSSAPNMFKINPDGTVGPLHLKRHANATGVVHA